MCRMLMLRPSGWLMSSRNRMTVSKLSSGSPMPINTMCETGRPDSFSENSTSFSISEGVRFRTSPPMVEAQKAHPCRQPTCEEMQTVFP